MFQNTKKILLFLAVLLNVVACSYSPSALKEMYRELPEEFSSDLKESVNLNAKQSERIDEYVMALGAWHRQHKLPTYSQDFAQFANLIRRGDIQTASLLQLLDKFDGMPHFEEATHLTSQLALLARTLSDAQISQLEKSLNDELMVEFNESKKKVYADEVVEELGEVFSLIGLSFSSTQKTSLRADASKLHDLRDDELVAEKHNIKQFIAVLRSANTPEFFAQFSRVWSQQDVVLTGKAGALDKQNDQVFASMMKNLILGFSPERREQFADKLNSISQTLSEMANE